MSEYCPVTGSKLDSNGQHMDQWKTSWLDGDRTIRPKLYRVWSKMKERCLNPNHKSYKYYGGRGISICSEWLEFPPFRQWMLAQEYDGTLELDRIDNDQGYFPDNCQLATHTDQVQNRRLPNRHKTGKRYGRRGFTAEDIYKIRESRLTNTALANIYDVHDATIGKIKKRTSWKHLPERPSVPDRLAENDDG